MLHVVRRPGMVKVASIIWLIAIMYDLSVLVRNITTDVSVTWSYVALQLIQMIPAVLFGVYFYSLSKKSLLWLWCSSALSMAVSMQILDASIFIRSIILAIVFGIYIAEKMEDGQKVFT